jgi:hypothetical protein
MCRCGLEDSARRVCLRCILLLLLI